MKKLMRFLALLAAVAGLLTVHAGEPAATAPRPAPKASDLFTNAIVAKGIGVSVSRSALDEAVIGVRASMAARRETPRPDTESQVLLRLIQVQLLLGKATDADRAAGKELAEQRVGEIRMRAGTDEVLEQQLKPIGLTIPEFIAKVTEEATAETVLKRELKTEVSDADIKKFYDDNAARSEQPEMVRAAHVLIGITKPNPQMPGMQADLTDAEKAAKRKVAEDVLKRARSGEDFAKLVKEFTDDVGSKDNGGEYTFPRGQMMPEFEAAAFSLKTNQVSDIVTTRYGYHIIKLYENMPARKATLDDEVTFSQMGTVVIKKYWNGPPEVVRTAAPFKQIIRQKLESDQQQKQIPDYMDKIVKDAKVEVLDERLKPLPSARPGVPGAP